MVWCPHLFKSFSQFIMINTGKGFSVVDVFLEEVDVFLAFPFVFSMIQRMLATGSLVRLPFLNRAWTSGSSWMA